VYAKPIPQSSAAFFRLDEVTERRRHELEVFFAPSGRYTFINIHTNEPHDREPDVSLTVTSRLIVAGWLTPLGEDISSWQPDKSVWLVGPIVVPRRETAADADLATESAPAKSTPSCRFKE
jgi:hypothetical protein